MSTTKTTFIPPKFGKFSTLTSDLFSKKYAGEHTFKVVRKNTKGSTEVSIISAPAADLNRNVRGSLKEKFVNGLFEVEAEIQTEATRESKVSFKRNRLVPGLNVTVTQSSMDSEIRCAPDAKSTCGVTTVDAEYTRDHIFVTGTFKTNGSKHLLKKSLAVGFDGVSVGAATSIDIKQQNLTDYNFGVEFAKPTYTASLFTKNKAETVVASVFRRSGKDLFGAQLSTDLGLKKPTLTFGMETELNAFTSVKVKSNINAAKEIEVYGAVEHRLVSPQMSVGVSASLKPSFVPFAPVPAQTFGATFTVGDY